MRPLLILLLSLSAFAQTKVDYVTQIKNKPIFDARSYGSNWTAVQSAVTAACAAGGGVVQLPKASYTATATLTISCSNVSVIGAGEDGTTVTRTGDFGDTIYINGGVSGVTNVHVKGLTLEQTINYAEGTPPTVSNKPTSGAHVRVLNCKWCSVEDSRLFNMPYGIVLDTVGWTAARGNTIKSVWDASYSAVQIGIAGIALKHSQSGYGYPTYTWVEQNVITGYDSAPRTVTVNGNAILNVRVPTGPQYGIKVESCEVCWIRSNTTEYCNDSGIGIVAGAAHAVTDALLAISIEDNYIDYNRLYGINFDMSAETTRFALGTKIRDNWIFGSNGSLNGIYFAPPAVSTEFVRTASETVITGNIIRETLGSGILMWSGGNTQITGNNITSYNALDSYPTNAAGDQVGNSGIYAGEAAFAFSVTGNRIGGGYLGAAYNGTTIWTINGYAQGTLYWTSATGSIVTTPNEDGGVQAPGSRSVPVAYDPAFFAATITPSTNYIATESGSNNAIAGSLSGVQLTAGLTVTVKLAHTLQAGANTFAYNGGSPVAIKSSRNSANDIGTAYAATGTITLTYNGTAWLDCSQ